MKFHLKNDVFARILQFIFSKETKKTFNFPVSKKFVCSYLNIQHDMYFWEHCEIYKPWLFAEENADNHFNTNTFPELATYRQYIHLIH